MWSELPAEADSRFQVRSFRFRPGTGRLLVNLAGALLH